MTNQHNHDHDHDHYIVPLPVFYRVFAALIALTVITVLASYVDFGRLNFVVAMLIASTKATLVVLFFMQLKYSSIDDKSTMVASVFFMAVFILFTASDLWFRTPVEPVKVAAAAASAGETDPNKLRISTPQLLEKGKAIYAQNCVTCHGVNGGGNGIAAEALYPKPRNFIEAKWKYGGTPTQLFATITKGIAGGAMASFAHLSVEERYAVIHYVRAFNPNNPPDTDATLKAAGLMGGAAAAVAEKMVEPIPIEMALANMAEPDLVILPGEEVNPGSNGAKLYSAYCAQCHGNAGQGAEVMALGVNPRAAVVTPAFKHASPWLASEGKFIEMVSKGLPGRSKPGLAGFSKAEWNELYAYVRGLSK